MDSESMPGRFEGITADGNLVWSSLYLLLVSTLFSKVSAGIDPFRKFTDQVELGY